jgi:hypothetical protein
MRSSPKEKLKKLAILKTLPYIEIAEAHRYIAKGADVQLLYFWLNLKADKYHEHFNIKSVIRQATYFAEKFPDLREDVIKWITKYTEHRKKTEIDEIIQKLDKALSDEKPKQSDNGELS